MTTERAKTYNTPASLIDAGLAPSSSRPLLEKISQRYAIAVSDHLAALINRDDPNDPIARQFVPDGRELNVSAYERADPIGDHAHSPCEGLVHRYRDRVLLKLLKICPVYCRFCFRRETIGPDKGALLSRQDFSRAVDYLKNHAEIWEVILTGGDPLALSARRLDAVFEALAAIDHIQVVRIHTRVPLAAPDLVNEALLDALKRAKTRGLQIAMAIHVNHPQELSPAGRDAVSRLSDAGALLLSQTVLLAGVNADAAVVIALMRALVKLGIRPYYLHHPDLAPGTGHFRMSLAAGLSIYEIVKRECSGLARPNYVIDIPGGFGKISVDSAAVVSLGAGAWRLKDSQGRWHDYFDEGELRETSEQALAPGR